MITQNAPNADGPSKAPKIEYVLQENGDVTRTDQDGSLVVAKYDPRSKTVRLVDQFAKFRPAVIRFLNENEVAIDSILMEGAKPDVPVPGVVIPPKPKRDPRYGDKTPEIVEWYRKWKPNEYMARYGIKGPGIVTKFRMELNERGEKVKVPYQVEATVALRKTHLTEKVEANVHIEGDEDSGESPATAVVG